MIIIIDLFTKFIKENHSLTFKIKEIYENKIKK